MKKSIRARLDNPEKKKSLNGKTGNRRMKLLDKELAEAAPNAREGVLSLERMMVLKVSGLTYEEVGKVMGCSQENVIKRLTPYRDTINGLRDFQDNKADMYDIIQSRIIAGIDEKKIREAKLFDLIRSADSLETMGRKVRGLDAHKNVNVFSITVKAAFPVPDKKARVINEGLSNNLLGTGVSSDLCEGVVQEVPRDGEPGTSDSGGDREQETVVMQMYEEGGDPCPRGEEE
jgi:hypothetical protein